MRSGWPVALVAALVALATPGHGQPLPRANPERASVPLPREKPPAPLPEGPSRTGDVEACPALASGRIVATRLDPFRDGACAIAHPLAVSEVAGVALSPAATINCGLATALADWIDETVQPAARSHRATQVTALRIAASLVCRGRNGIAGAKLSEHGFGNAVDVGAFVFADGRDLAVAPPEALREDEAAFLVAVWTLACGHFTTTLGPGSDGFHENHVHLDLAERRGGYRLCE